MPAKRTPGTCTNCCSANRPKPPQPITPIPTSDSMGLSVGEADFPVCQGQRLAEEKPTRMSRKTDKNFRHTNASGEKRVVFARSAQVDGGDGRSGSTTATRR